METPGNKIPGSRLKPYGIIVIAAILAYLPVSSFLFSLKNDVIAIEYPIQHFISQSLRHGQFPYWFNTWSMGFPLQSILTWGVYSTPRMLTGWLFESNIYILQAEFVFFIIMSGVAMFRLLKKHFLKDEYTALLLSCCYMLSGFTVGSSQWLLYLTGLTFIPLSIYLLLQLIKNPSIKYALLFAVSYYLLFTNVHIYLVLTATYGFIFFTGAYFLRLSLGKSPAKARVIKFSLFSFLLTALLCAAPAYYSVETISFLERSLPLEGNSVFFQSNYLHPDGLASFLIPLSSIKTTHFNTEGTVLDTYIGLLPLILLPFSLFLNWNRKNNRGWQLLMAAIFFMLISFGHLLPFRGWLNLFPGMSHFRHPGVLRIFFNLFLVLYLAQSFDGLKWKELFLKSSVQRKWLVGTTISLLFISLVTLFCYSGYLTGIWKGSFYETIKTINKNELILVSAAIQSLFLILLLLSALKRPVLFSYILIAELVINTLACTPFFTISAYKTKEVATVLRGVDGFPVQQVVPSSVPATYIDEKGNNWQNINTYKKQVSTDISMPGPLIIEKVAVFLSAGGRKEILEEKEVLFLRDTTKNHEASIKIVTQFPSKIIADIKLLSPGELVLQQAAFPGWKAFYNGKEISLLKNDLPFVCVGLPAGQGKLEFRFEKPGVLYSALLLHLFVLLTIGFYTARKFFVRASYPS